MHIILEKNMISDTILSNEIDWIQQNYQRHHGSNDNMPSDPSDQKSYDKNFDNRIQVSSYDMGTKLNWLIQIFYYIFWKFCPWHGQNPYESENESKDDLKWILS